MADDLFRARLTGANLDDPADLVAPAQPVNERAALVEYIKADSGLGVGSVEAKGRAKVVLSSGRRCPTFAARYMLFGNVAYNPPTTGALLALAQQPRVTIRREVTSSTGAGETCCNLLIIDPVVPAILTGRVGASGAIETPSLPATPGSFGRVAVEDHLGNRVTDILAYFPAWNELTKIEAGSPVQLVNRVLRSDVPGRSGEVEVWVMNPLGGTGPGFAIYAPSTAAEAQALGWPVV